MRYRFAVLDGPPPPNDTLADVQTQRQQFDTKYAALYHPWLLIPDPFPANLATIRQISDAAIGPRARHLSRAPTSSAACTRRRPTRWCAASSACSALPQQGRAGHPQSLPGQHQRHPRLPRRTTAASASGAGACITSDPDWKYVNVRRLLIFIEDVDRPRPAVGGVRAERRAAVGARAPLDHQLPDQRLAQRRARGHEAPRRRSSSSATARR